MTKLQCRRLSDYSLLQQPAFIHKYLHVKKQMHEEIIPSCYTIAQYKQYNIQQANQYLIREPHSSKILLVAYLKSNFPPYVFSHYIHIPIWSGCISTGITPTDLTYLFWSCRPIPFLSESPVSHLAALMRSPVPDAFKLNRSWGWQNDR